MFTDLELTFEPIQPATRPREKLHATASGAIITFLGVVRGVENGESISALEYSAFEAMARHQFELLFRTIAERWPISAVRVIHRLGKIPAGHTSLWVEVCAPHRAEAFAACQWLIDQMKVVVPIWKKPIK